MGETDDELRARLRVALTPGRLSSPDQVACAFAEVLTRYGYPCWVVVGGGGHGELVVDVVSWAGWKPTPALLYSAREALIDFLPVWMLVTVTLNPKGDGSTGGGSPDGACIGASGGPAVTSGAATEAGAYRRLQR